MTDPQTSSHQRTGTEKVTGIETRADSDPAAKPEEVLIQLTLFTLSPRERLPEPKIKTEDVPKRRSRRRRESPDQQHFQFETSPSGVVRYPDEPGFRHVIEREALPQPTTLQLSQNVTVDIPSSLNELMDRYGITNIKAESLQSIPGQLAAILKAILTPENGAFQGRTGSGKTFVELIIAAHKLSQGEEVLLLAPTETLVEQHLNKAATLLQVDPCYLHAVTGEVLPVKRPGVYQKSKGLLIATPETIRNDIEGKILDPSRFSTVIFDEAHMAVGEYAYAQIAKLLPSRTTKLLFSATLAKNISSLQELLALMQVKYVHEIEIPPQMRFEGTFKVKVAKSKDEVLYDAQQELLAGVIKSALDFSFAYERSCELSWGIISAINSLKRFRKETGLGTISREMAEQTPHEVLAQSFKIPSFAVMERLREKVSGLANQYPKRFGFVASEYYRLRYMLLLYSSLTGEGQFSFLQRVGMKLWESRFGGSADPAVPPRPRKVPHFHRRVVNSPAVLRSFLLLAKDTPYELLATHTSKSFRTLISKVYPSGIPDDVAQVVNSAHGTAIEQSEELWKAKSKIAKYFFASARKCMVEREYIDHPKERIMHQIVQRHCSFGSKDQVMVFDSSALSTLFYADRISHRLRALGISAVAVVGKKHRSSKERRESIKALRTGEANVLVGNSAANTGLDLPGVKVVIRMTHSTQPIDSEQTTGRAAREEGAIAYIYDVLTTGSPDEFRYYAGKRNAKSMRRAIQITREENTPR